MKLKHLLSAIVLVAFFLAASLSATGGDLSSKPVVPLVDLIVETSVLPAPWNALPLHTVSTSPSYAHGARQNLKAIWRGPDRLEPSLAQWVLEYGGPLGAAYALNVSMPISAPDEPGQDTYEPGWQYKPQFAEEADTDCLDLGTGIPVRPEACNVRMRYGQYVIWITLNYTPVDTTTFLSIVALMDEHVANALRLSW